MHDVNSESHVGAPEPGAAVRYTIAVAGRVEEGTARSILQSFKDSAEPDTELAQITFDRYVDLLVGDADYFIPAAALRFLASRPYPTKYDRALTYLATMPSSQVRILAKEEAAAAHTV